MPLILFLDDWMLDDYHDIVRRFPKPVPAPVPPYSDAHNHSTILRDRDTGDYRLWYRRYFAHDDPAERRAALCLAASRDGYHWERVIHGYPSDRHYPDRPDSIFIPNRPDGGGMARVHGIYGDDHETDPSRRFKAVDYQGWVLFSPDGLQWRIEPGHRVFNIPSGSDTLNNIFWNPISGNYQVHHRPVNVDRRVAMSESPDLVHWTYRGAVFQADAQDPPRLEIYGMPAFWYEDLFIAFPWLYRVPGGETGRRWKMLGHLEGGLAYSYNGLNWLRPYYEPFLPLAEPGQFGAGNFYPVGLVLGADDTLRLYACGYKPQHGDMESYQHYLQEGDDHGAMVTHTLRKDGFAFLEPMGGWGWLRTKTILPQAGDLRLNIQAPIGQVQVQITDDSAQPIPGFTFEESIPLQGDGVALQPRWAAHRLEELIGRPCRVELKLFSARVYAIRWTSQTFYAKEPQTHY